jgi:hypothetical protein
MYASLLMSHHIKYISLDQALSWDAQTPGYLNFLGDISSTQDGTYYAADIVNGVATSQSLDLQLYLANPILQLTTLALATLRLPGYHSSSIPNESIVRAATLHSKRHIKLGHVSTFRPTMVQGGPILKDFVFGIFQKYTYIFS